MPLNWNEGFGSFRACLSFTRNEAKLTADSYRILCHLFLGCLWSSLRLVDLVGYNWVRASLLEVNGSRVNVDVNDL